MPLPPFAILPVAIVAVVIVALLLYYRFGPKYVTRLTCQKCSQQFDYNWVPGISFNAVRLGKWRYMRCPLCGRWSLFNVWDTKTVVAKP
ncbi:MAG TPA: hypothetical protein VND15_00780 [Candidatus Acidoferrales bacterium]|nr:hypothetical protein [Candidatus Acidoferrales bacterium]